MCGTYEERNQAAGRRAPEVCVQAKSPNSSWRRRGRPVVRSSTREVGAGTCVLPCGQGQCGAGDRQRPRRSAEGLRAKLRGLDST